MDSQNTDVGLRGGWRISRRLGWGLGDPVCTLFSPCAITEAHASAWPQTGDTGALTFMVCVADLAAHHVPSTEDTRRRTEGRGHVRAVGPSHQSPDISTAASARGPARLSGLGAASSSGETISYPR